MLSLLYKTLNLLTLIRRQQGRNILTTICRSNSLCEYCYLKKKTIKGVLHSVCKMVSRKETKQTC